MSRIIINNKSTAPDSVVLTAVTQCIIKGEPYKQFYDFQFGKDAYLCIAWHPNLDSDRFTAYNSTK